MRTKKTKSKNMFSIAHFHSIKIVEINLWKCLPFPLYYTQNSKQFHQNIFLAHQYF